MDVPLAQHKMFLCDAVSITSTKDNMHNGVSSSNNIWWSDSEREHESGKQLRIPGRGVGGRGRGRMPSARQTERPYVCAEHTGGQTVVFSNEQFFPKVKLALIEARFSYTDCINIARRWTACVN